MRRLLLARPDLWASWTAVVMLFGGAVGCLASLLAFLAGFVSERQTDAPAAVGLLLMSPLPWELRHRVQPARRLAFLLIALAFGMMIHWLTTRS